MLFTISSVVLVITMFFWLGMMIVMGILGIKWLFES